MVWRYAAVAAIALSIVLWIVNRAGAQEVDVALVLAVDVSGSIDYAEAKLQREGYAAALESPEVLEAIKNGLVGKIALAYVEWAGEPYQKIILEWTVIDGPESARSVAYMLRQSHPAGAGGAAVGNALLFSAAYLDQMPLRTDRRVIDVSGDMDQNAGIRPEEARDALIARGITINGLAVGEEHVFRTFQRRIVGGPGAFAIWAPGPEHFAMAVRTKLALEIAGAFDRQYAAR